MGVLIDLPDDILRDIFEELVVLVDKWRNRFEKDKKSLSSLMQTNRRLNRLASRILLREIKINIVCREKYKGAFRDGFEHGMFLEAFKGNPLLASLVRVVVLEWEGPIWHWCLPSKSDEAVSNKKTNELLALLPKIESLEIQTNSDCRAFTPDFLKTNPALNLRKLQLTGPSNLNHFIEYLKIPSLDDLGVDHPSLFERLRPDVVETRAALARSEVSTLYLGTTHLPLSELSMLLGLFSSIKTLRMGTPFSDAEGDIIRQPEWRNWTFALSPRSVRSLIGQFRHTLVNLWLWNDNYPPRWSSHDRSRLDLSKFEMLRKVHVPSDCFFASHTPDATREGVWRLLPPRLEDLKVNIRVYSRYVSQKVISGRLLMMKLSMVGRAK